MMAMKRGHHTEIQKWKTHVQLTLSIILTFCFISPGSAEESIDSEKIKIFQLNDVVVTASELERDIETPNMTVIKPELFPKGIGTSLDTALERQPGIDVQRIQSVGTAIDDDSIKIRGFGARRLKVMVDGRLLNTPGTAGGYFIDWTMISLNNVDRIEVIKGTSDPRYGNVLGGIINLVSRKPGEKPITELEASFSRYDTSSYNLYHSWEPGKFDYSLSAGYSDSDGYLRNGNFKSKNIGLNLGYELPFSGRLWASAQYIEINKGFIVENRISNDIDDPDYNAAVDPGYPPSDGEFMYGGVGAYAEPGSWWERKKWLFNVGYEQDLFENGTVDVRYWENKGDREEYNTRASAGRIFHKTFFEDRSYGASADYRHYYSGHTLTTSIDYTYLKDDGDRNYPDDFRAEFRNGYYVASKNIGIFLMDDISFDNGLIITPGLRYMSYDGESGPAGKLERIPDISMSGMSPSLKVTYNYEAENLVYFSISRALRMPTPPEHYWHYDDDDGAVDMSDLPFNEEDGIMLQAGWKATLSTDTRIEISPYYYQINDYIQFDLINFVSYNIDEAKIYGLEFELVQKINSNWSGFFNYTWQKSRTKGDPFVETFLAPSDQGFNEIPGLPEHRGNLGVQYKWQNKAKIAAFITAVSSQDVISSDNRLLWGSDPLRIRNQDSYMTFDIEGTYRITENNELGLYCRNLFDEEYQERFGYASAGMIVGGSIKMSF